MKRIIAILFISFCLIGLCACGILENNDNQASTSTPKSTVPDEPENATQLTTDTSATPELTSQDIQPKYRSVLEIHNYYFALKIDATWAEWFGITEENVLEEKARCKNAGIDFKMTIRGRNITFDELQNTKVVLYQRYDATSGDGHMSDYERYSKTLYDFFYNGINTIGFDLNETLQYGTKEVYKYGASACTSQEVYNKLYEDAHSTVKPHFVDEYFLSELRDLRTETPDIIIAEAKGKNMKLVDTTFSQLVFNDADDFYGVSNLYLLKSTYNLYIGVSSGGGSYQTINYEIKDLQSEVTSKLYSDSMWPTEAKDVNYITLFIRNAEDWVCYHATFKCDSEQYKLIIK